MDLPKIVSNEDLHGLRALYDRIEAATRSLKSVGVPSSNCSALLSPLVMSRFPQELHLLISRKLEEEWSVTKLLESMGEDLTIREKCALASLTSQQASREQQGNIKVNKFTVIQGQPSTTSTLLAENTSYQGNGHIPHCLFCGNNHFSASCTAITDPNMRKKIIREKKR